MTLITESRLRAMVRNGIPNPYPVKKNDKLTPAATDFLKEKGIMLQSTDYNQVIQNNFDHSSELTIPVGVSNRHVHLTKKDLESLFGNDYTLTNYRGLSQPGQFAAEEKVTILGPKGFIQGVRILGPTRDETQIEISRTDGFQLGIHPQVRLSGDIKGTPGVTLLGPKGSVTLNRGVIVAKCHVHMSLDDAKGFQVKNGDSLMLKTLGERSIIFTDVAVRVGPKYVLDFHIDLDEANAACLKTGDDISVIGKNGRMFFWDGR